MWCVNSCFANITRRSGYGNIFENSVHEVAADRRPDLGVRLSGSRRFWSSTRQQHKSHHRYEFGTSMNISITIGKRFDGGMPLPPIFR